jgi:hypothetical protein
MAAVLGTMLLARDAGVSYSVSTGNEAASGVEDYVDWMVDQPDTHVIAMIVEQFRKPQRFLAAARARGRRASRSSCCIPASRAPRANPPPRIPARWRATTS